MICADAIPDLVALLQARKVYLWHACQFRDFQSYLALGGIPSRDCLKSSGSEFTAFETDSTDQKNRVWDKVFVNLSDFGFWFSKGAKNVPNPYGPIVLKIRPQALCEAADVAVCLRSAGASGFDRAKEALKSVQEVDLLFEHPVEAGFPLCSFVKFEPKLRETFPSAEEPEVSCTVPGGNISISNVELACVDPYRLADKQLNQHVEEARARHKAAFRVQERSCTDPSRRVLYNELSDVIANGVPALNGLAEDKSLSENLRAWCQNIMKLEWQFKRYAAYLRDGTLLPILRPDGLPNPATTQAPVDPSPGDKIPF